MSRFGTSFNFFTPTNYTNPNQAITFVMNKDLRSLRYYSGSLNAVRDEQNNNLLHLATLNESIDIVKYLLDQNVDKNYKNKFNLTPLDYAIRSHNKELLQLFWTNSLDRVHVLTNDNENLKQDNANLRTRNTILNQENESYKSETVVLKRENKRLRDDNDDLLNKVNRLTNENTELVQENKKLKISVDSMTKALRK